MRAIASPIFCTSFGARCFITSAAASSPIESSSSALSLTPASFTLRHPALDDVGDDAWILLRDEPRALQRLFAAGRAGQRRRKRRRGERFGGRDLDALGSAAQRRSQHTEHQVCNEQRERSEEHTSELQSLAYLVCRLLLEKKKK